MAVESEGRKEFEVQKPDKHIWKNLLPLGIIVLIGGNIEGMINGVSIYLTGDVSYQVIYWHDGERQSVWISEYEIQVLDDVIKSPHKIGFNDPRS